MWKSACVGIHQLLNWKVRGETLKLIIWVLWSDRPLMVGFIFVLSHFIVSKKMISVSIPLFVAVHDEKSTTCIKLNVFINVSSVNISVLLARKFIFRSPQIS